MVGFDVLTLLTLDDQVIVEPEPAGIVVANERSETTTDNDEPLLMSLSTTAALSAAKICAGVSTLPLLSLLTWLKPRPAIKTLPFSSAAMARIRSPTLKLAIIFTSIAFKSKTQTASLAEENIA